MEEQQTRFVHKKGRQGLDSFWKKLKAKVLKKEKLSSGQQTRTTSTASTLAPIPDLHPVHTEQPKTPERQIASSSIDHSAQKPVAPPITNNMFDDSTDPDRRLEKARAIFQKYDLEFSPSEWVTTPKVHRERVKKDIRMRVRYTCHSCKTVFGHDRICVSCQHRRCNNCIRYPPRREHKHTTQGQDTVRSQEAAGPTMQQLQKTEGDCTCHECQTSFEVGATECPNCHHKVCDRCLREALVIASSSGPQETSTGEKSNADRQIASS